MFKTFLLLFLLMALFIGIGRLLGGRRGMVIAFVIALGLNFGAYWFSDTLVLRAYNARPAPEGHRLVRITKDLVRRADLPMPKVYILPTSSPNAFATGRNPEHAAVAATEGLLRTLPEGQLRGVIAHELGHVKNRDTLTQTVAASISGGVLLLSRMAIFFGGGSRRSWGARLAVSIVAPVAATLVTMAISREREYEADEFAARLTKEPRMLAAALKNISSGSRAHRMPEHSPETAHMFIVNPFSGTNIGQLFSTHPPMEKRIARLNELAGELR